MNTPILDILENAKSPADAKIELLQHIDNHSVCHALAQFNFGHLPDHLKLVSGRYASLATALANQAPATPELTLALRKLLEAKDAGVRAVIQ